MFIGAVVETLLSSTNNAESEFKVKLLYQTEGKLAEGPLSFASVG